MKLYNIVESCWAHIVLCLVTTSSKQSQTLPCKEQQLWFCYLGCKRKTHRMNLAQLGSLWTLSTKDKGMCELGLQTAGQ